MELKEKDREKRNKVKQKQKQSVERKERERVKWLTKWKRGNEERSILSLCQWKKNTVLKNNPPVLGLF